MTSRSSRSACTGPPTKRMRRHARRFVADISLVADLCRKDLLGLLSRKRWRDCFGLEAVFIRRGPKVGSGPEAESSGSVDN
jgi:hypothetical protein